MPVPLEPPPAKLTDLSEMQIERERLAREGRLDRAAMIFADAAREYVRRAMGPLGDRLGGGLTPLWEKSPNRNGRGWQHRGMGKVGDTPGMDLETAVYERFGQAGEHGADSIGTVCGSGLLVMDVDNWDPVPPAMWEILETGLMVSNRRNVAERRAHIGWRVGADDYVMSLAGFDGLGGEGWKADGIGQLRSAGGMTRIWSGAIGSTVAARDPQWFLDLPMAGAVLLDRLEVQKGDSGGVIFNDDLQEWLRAHTEESVDSAHRPGWSEDNIGRQIEFFRERLREGVSKYEAMKTVSLKAAADVAAEACGGHEAYTGLLEAYRQAGVETDDWIESVRIPEYNRMWTGAVGKILAGRFDDLVQKSASRVGNPLATWRAGQGGEWTASLDGTEVDPETGEILERSSGREKEAGWIQPPSEGSEHDTKSIDITGLTAEDMADLRDMDPGIRRIVAGRDGGDYRPDDQLLGVGFWESRSVLDFIRKWAWSHGGHPDAVLMGVLAGLGAVLPLDLVLNPLGSSPAPLTLYVVGVAPSGAGKSLNQRLALRLLRQLEGDYGALGSGKVTTTAFGTAEGLLDLFYRKLGAKELEQKRKQIEKDFTPTSGGGKFDGTSLTADEIKEQMEEALARVKAYQRHVDGIIVMSDESKNLTQMDAQGGQGTISMMLSAWSGVGNISPAYVKDRDRPKLEAMKYRVSMNASIQAALAHDLLGGEQADNGFAQRALLFVLNRHWPSYDSWVEELLTEWRKAGREAEIAEDAELAGMWAVMEQAEWYDLQLAGTESADGRGRSWVMPRWDMVSGIVAGVDPEVGDIQKIQVSPDCGYWKAKLEAEKRQLRYLTGDPLETHAVFSQLRVAALLGLLECGWVAAGRKTVEVGPEDWELAGQIMACTVENRAYLERLKEFKRKQKRNEIGEDMAITEAARIRASGEMSWEMFREDLLRHMRRAHSPEFPEHFKGGENGEMCPAWCWQRAGVGKARQVKLGEWKFEGLWRQVSDKAGDEEAQWFPSVSVPGILRIHTQPTSGGGRHGWVAVLETADLDVLRTKGIEVHPDDLRRLRGE
jgi:hypothetical protein